MRLPGVVDLYVVMVVSLSFSVVISARIAKWLVALGLGVLARLRALVVLLSYWVGLLGVGVDRLACLLELGVVAWFGWLGLVSVSTEVA